MLTAKIDMESFHGAYVAVNQHHAAIRAQELAAWLKLQDTSRSAARARVDSRPEWQEKIKGRPGIVYFADYWRRPAEKDSTGDHIDLWNGRRLTASGLEGTLVTFMRFGLGINSGILYSDLGSARAILIWEVKWLGSAPRGLQPSSLQWQ